MPQIAPLEKPFRNLETVTYPTQKKHKDSWKKKKKNSKTTRIRFYLIKPV